MTEKAILSEKLEDNKAAAEWGMKQAELIKKSEEITQRLVEKSRSLEVANTLETMVQEIFTVSRLETGDVNCDLPVSPLSMAIFNSLGKSKKSLQEPGTCAII